MSEMRSEGEEPSPIGGTSVDSQSHHESVEAEIPKTHECSGTGSTQLRTTKAIRETSMELGQEQISKAARMQRASEWQTPGSTCILIYMDVPVVREAVSKAETEADELDGFAWRSICQTSQTNLGPPYRQSVSEPSDARSRTASVLYWLGRKLGRNK